MQCRTVCAGLALGLLACGSDGGNASDASVTEGDDVASADAAADVDAGPPPHGFRATYFRHHGEATTVERVEDALDVTWGEDGPAPEIGADRFCALDRDARRARGRRLHLRRAQRRWRAPVGRRRRAPLVDDWRFHFVERHEATVQLPASPWRCVEYFERTSPPRCTSAGARRRSPRRSSRRSG